MLSKVEVMVKKTLCAGLFVMLAFVLIGCAEKLEAPIADIVDITESVENVIGFDTDYMTRADRQYVFERISIDAEAITDYVMKLPTGMNQNEYGVFIAEKGHEKELEDAVLAYLDFRKEVWDEMYLPEEGFKIDNAEHGRQGRYIYYAIGCDSFKEIEEIFKELTKA